MNRLSVFHKFFAMRSPLFLAAVFLAFFGVIFLVTTGVVMATNRNQINDDDHTRSYHAITFYDDDLEKTIITGADTVTEALKDAEITLDEHDSIIPAVTTELTDAVMVINIRRARPVAIIDGARQVRTVTAATSPTDIATAAGVKLYPEDNVKLSRTDDLLAAGGAGLEMNIARAKMVNLKLYGQELVVRTQAETVAGLLKDKKIRLGAADGMSLAPTDKITNNMKLQIWRNGIQTVTSTEIVPFATKTIKDPERNIGYREVETAGKDGEKTVIFQVEMRDGVEVARKILSEVVNTPPVEQIEIIGTKVNLPPGGHEDWMRMAGISSSDYGYANFIFNKESTWRPTAVSRNGYYGLGQTSKSNLTNACGENFANDPICQIQFFDGYAKRRYGSWAGAYEFWRAHNWW